MGVILSFVVILFLCKRGQAKGFSGYWLKDMLFWEKGSTSVLTEKRDQALDPFQSYMDQIRQGETPEELEQFKRLKQER